VLQVLTYTAPATGATAATGENRRDHGEQNRVRSVPASVHELDDLRLNPVSTHSGLQIFELRLDKSLHLVT
jgi:hypothetical protein